MERGPSNGVALQAFLPQAQALLEIAQECLEHLQLLGDDSDACLCLTQSLDTLARGASAVGMHTTCEFIRAVLAMMPDSHLSRLSSAQALASLEGCLHLLDWHLQLVDPCSGGLALDCSEQHRLLHRFASAMGLPVPRPCTFCRLPPEGEAVPAVPAAAAKR